MRLEYRGLLLALNVGLFFTFFSPVAVSARPRAKVDQTRSSDGAPLVGRAAHLQAALLDELDFVGGEAAASERVATPLHRFSSTNRATRISDIEAEPARLDDAWSEGDEYEWIEPTSYQEAAAQARASDAEGWNHSSFDEGVYWEGEGEWIEDRPCYEACGAATRWWVQADYLVWWSKGNALPPLISTSPNETPRELAGVLAYPPSEVLYGNERVNNDARSGGRISLGLWLDECQGVGLGGTFFSLGDGTSNFSQSSLGQPILARPFLNAETGFYDAQIVAFSNSQTGDLAAGWVSASTKNEVLGADIYLRAEWQSYCNGRIDLIGGYRFSRIDEDLIVRDQIISTATGGLIPLGTTIDGLDYFKMRNEFHGGDIGWIVERHHGRWSLQWLTKVGLGTMRQQATIQGESVVTVPGATPFVRDGSLLAMPSNNGAYERDRFAVVPEVRLNLSYQINPCWKATLGYTFIYWNDVLRTGRQVDHVVNLSQLSGPPPLGPERPAFDFQSGDFWVQGLNVGLEYAF